MSRHSDRIVVDIKVQQTELQASPSVQIVSNSFKSNGENNAQSSSFDESDTTCSMRRHLSKMLIPSVLLSVLCFWPLGFAAIWQAIKSHRAAKTGQYKNAQMHSSMAKSFIAFSIALGILQSVSIVTVVMLQLYVFTPYTYNPAEAMAS